MAVMSIDEKAWMIYFIPVPSASFFICYNFFFTKSQLEPTGTLFVGIDVAFDNLDEMYELIDERLYTNLFFIESKGIS